MQSPSEKITAFGNKIQNDHANGDYFYKGFLTLATRYFHFSTDELEDIWQHVMLGFADENSNKLGLYSRDIDGTTSFKEDKIFFAFVMQSLMNACKNYLRSKIRRRNHLKIYSESRELYSNTPLEILLHEEEQEHIQRCMSKLTPEDQSLLRDYYWDGKEYTDIAFEKGMSRSTVNRKLRRAKINFYEAYQRITRAA